MALASVNMSVGSNAASNADGYSSNNFGGFKFGKNALGGGMSLPSWPVMAGAAVVLLLVIFLIKRRKK